MKRSLVIFAAAAALVAAAAGSTLAARALSGPVGKPAQLVFYGHIKSLVPKGRRFELRFDPALWLTGTAGEHICRCGPGLPNDYAILDETHRLLTFLVRPDAAVTIITRRSYETPITVAELAQILAGKNPKHRRLFERKAGFWIRIGEKYPGPVVSLGQQYQP
jgi:hypothetical protein